MRSLFDHAREKLLKDEQPLAARMRPRTLDEYIGQEHILAPGRLLRRAIQADQLSSLLFYGPPGTGKTTLASVIANTTSSFFVTLNAVMAGIADLREITQAAQRRLGEFQQRTILFIDEVHRWNKAQQDALLPWVENGTVILIGATTENPYFTVNRALVSRSRIFQLKPLQESDIQAIIRQALLDPERGYGQLQTEIAPAALEHLAGVANGDARAALNALELAVETTAPDAAGCIRITLEVAEESIQRRAVLYDREGDYHFDTISAFIKSMRGSDPDATLYWLAKMVYAGEDPRFIFRRMVIFASEDIGQADPQALPFVIAAAESFDRIGLPEGHYPLAHAALYCATAPKSNSVMGFFDALKLVGEEREGEVPNHLRDASRDKEGFGHGVVYQYPHAYRDHWVAQQYLPTALQGKIFYEPGEIGYEKKLAESIRQRRELQLAALLEKEGQLAPPEILSFSPADKNSERWLARAVEAQSNILGNLREHLFGKVALQRHELVLDLSGDSAVFTWEALRQTPEGGLWSLVRSQPAAQLLREQSQNLPDLRRPAILIGEPQELPVLLAAQKQDTVRFDAIVGRNILCSSQDRTGLAAILAALLTSAGRLCLLENIPRRGQRLSEFLPEKQDEWRRQLQAAEEKIYCDSQDPYLAWDENTLLEELSQNTTLTWQMEVLSFHREQIISAAQLQHWFAERNGSYADRLRRAGLSQQDVLRLRDSLPVGRLLPWNSTIAVLFGRTSK
ncbi:MAG: AAA family ATPase [Lentisphaerae bacterium]|nr:AAA family ATPase [Lentisphaerota bacterium]